MHEAASSSKVRHAYDVTATPSAAEGEKIDGEGTLGSVKRFALSLLVLNTASSFVAGRLPTRTFSPELFRPRTPHVVSKWPSQEQWWTTPYRKTRNMTRLRIDIERRRKQYKETIDIDKVIDTWKKDGTTVWHVGNATNIERLRDGGEKEKLIKAMLKAKLEIPKVFYKELDWRMFEWNCNFIDSCSDRLLQSVSSFELLAELMRSLKRRLWLKESMDVEFVNIDADPYPYMQIALKINLGGPWRWTNSNQSQRPWKDSVDLEGRFFVSFNDQNRIDSIRLACFTVNGQSLKKDVATPTVRLFDRLNYNLVRVLRWQQFVHKLTEIKPLLDEDEEDDELEVLTGQRLRVFRKFAGRVNRGVGSVTKAVDAITNSVAERIHIPGWQNKRKRLVKAYSVLASWVENAVEACTSVEAYQVCGVNIAADIIAQIATAGKGKALLPAILSLNLRRTFSLAMFGLVYSGGFQPNVYRRLDRIFGVGEALKHVLPKIFVDMFLYGPLIYVPSFYMFTGVLQGLSLAAAYQVLVARYKVTVISYIAIWLAPSFYIFKWVPEDYRTLCRASLGFVEKCLLAGVIGGKGAAPQKPTCPSCPEAPPDLPVVAEELPT